MDEIQIYRFRKIALGLFVVDVFAVLETACQQESCPVINFLWWELWIDADPVDHSKS